MKQNAASWDRAFRALAGLAMLVCAVIAPLSLVVRVLAFGGVGLYMLATAIFGSCLGYTLMGISTCPANPKSRA